MIGALAILAGVALIASEPPSRPSLVDESHWQKVLTTHVSEARVDYAGLKQDRSALDAYLREIGAVSSGDFRAAPKEIQAAYLINAYNAYTLAAIVDAYPIKGGFFGGADSIRGIKKVWSAKTRLTALGFVSLDDIEHENLRKSYGLPGVHMALVCASKGCPPLRGEPYVGRTLPAQLEDQAGTYLASPYGLVVKGGEVSVSAIFKWFGDDWAKQGGWKAWVAERAPADRRAAVKKALDADDYSWLSYDWSLNEKAK